MPTTSRRPGPTTRVRVSEWVDSRWQAHEDRLATEEPLELRLAWPGRRAERFVITMRTPGHDFDLAAGLVHAEGLSRGAVPSRVAYCTDVTLAPEQEFNVVTVTLSGPPDRVPTARATSMSAACGVCGKQTLEDLAALGAQPLTGGTTVSGDVVAGLPDRLRTAQTVFERTGGLHGAALCSPTGELRVVREDVGRHNAVDKVVGHSLLHGITRSDALLCVSGRVGYEIVQKAVMASIPVIVAVGAPSSLAVDLAESFGVTVIGWVRDDRMVVYSHPDRLHQPHHR
ncbi:MAG: formate dehydrogenase accessory sulfurtransferase FdhD [Nocardioidaceae bacterium]